MSVGKKKIISMIKVSFWTWKVGGLAVNIQEAATDPVLCDIFYLVQYLYWT